jgi:hypothetical protein
MNWIVVELLFGATNTVIAEGLSEAESAELVDKLNEGNHDKLYREYVACPEDPTPN